VVLGKLDGRQLAPGLIRPNSTSFTCRYTNSS
jgi:hypothetical protein